MQLYAFPQMANITVAKAGIQNNANCDSDKCSDPSYVVKSTNNNQNRHKIESSVDKEANKEPNVDAQHMTQNVHNGIDYVSCVSQMTKEEAQNQ